MCSVDEVLAQLDDAIDVASALDARELDAEEIGAYAVALQQRLSRLEAVATRAAGVFDANGDAHNAKSSAAWLAHHARLPKWKAQQAISNARALRHMPAVDEAFAAGEIGSEHVRALARARAADPDAFAAKGEELLVDDAERCRFDLFSRSCGYWRQLAAADLVEDEAQATHESRKVHASKTFGGTVVVDGVMDPVGGDAFLCELTRLEDELFRADWNDAKVRLGRGPLLHELDRTPAQRRHDALVLMAERSAAVPEGATPLRPLINVLVGYETFAGRICELADGTVLTPGQVVSLLDDADVRRVVFDGPGRVIDVGPRRRLFTGATRVAVQLADLECQGDPSCDVRFDRCETDHVEPHAWGGDTIRSNGSLECRWHHRRRRRGP